MSRPFSRTAVALLVLVALPLAARVRAVRSGPIDTPGAWIRHRAISLDDLSPLVHLTASAQVVAFGDATHGTHETYAARLRAIPELIEKNGFRVLAVEGSYAQWAALDEYLLTGHGNPAELLRNDYYWFWNTQEVLDLLLWARARNAAGMTPPIRIGGVDSTEPVAAAARVVAALRRVDADLAQFAEQQYTCVPNACNATLREVRTRIESRRALFASADEFEEALHAARVVEQGIDIYADFLGNRDAIMAENILWLTGRGKVIVWGHNEHWSRTDYQLEGPRVFRSTGAILTAALGTGYFVIGSVIRDGVYLTENVDLRRVVEQEFDAMRPEDWAGVLDESRLTSVIVPLHAPHPGWMDVARPMRFAGSSGRILETTRELAGKFDAVLYIRTSTPVLLRRWPVF